MNFKELLKRVTNNPEVNNALQSQFNVSLGLPIPTSKITNSENDNSSYNQLDFGFKLSADEWLICLNKSLDPQKYPPMWIDKSYQKSQEKKQTDF